MVQHKGRESKAREDSRTPGRSRAHRPAVACYRSDGLRMVAECGSPLPLSLETECKDRHWLVPRQGAEASRVRSIPLSRRLKRARAFYRDRVAALAQGIQGSKWEEMLEFSEDWTRNAVTSVAVRAGRKSAAPEGSPPDTRVQLQWGGTGHPAGPGTKQG